MAGEVIFLILGVFLGLLASALLEDDLKDVFNRARVRFRRRRDKELAAKFVEEFTLGPIRTGFHTLEGDGTRFIAEDNVRVILDATDVVLPDDLVPWREEKARELEARSGGNPAWNGPRYAVAKVAVSRVGENEDPEVCFTFKHSDYLNFLTTQQLDRAFADGTTPRSRYLDGRGVEELPDFMANSFGAHVALVTADDYLVFSQRGPNVAVQPLKWSSSMGEGLARGLDSEGTGPPNLYAVARRGLREELGLDRSQYRLDLLAIGLAGPVHQWVGLFFAQLSELTWQELSDSRARGVQDPWEHMEHVAVKFNPDEVLEFILDGSRVDEWTPMSPPLYYYALVKEFGRMRVERKLRRLKNATVRP